MMSVAYWACLAAYPNRKGYTTDVCMPISKLAECIVDAQNRAKYVTLFTLSRRRRSLCAGMLAFRHRLLAT